MNPADPSTVFDAIRDKILGITPRKRGDDLPWLFTKMDARVAGATVRTFRIVPLVDAMRDGPDGQSLYGAGFDVVLPFLVEVSYAGLTVYDASILIASDGPQLFRNLATVQDPSPAGVSEIAAPGPLWSWIDEDPKTLHGAYTFEVRYLNTTAP